MQSKSHTEIGRIYTTEHTWGLDNSLDPPEYKWFVVDSDGPQIRSHRGFEPGYDNTNGDFRTPNRHSWSYTTYTYGPGRNWSGDGNLHWIESSGPQVNLPAGPLSPTHVANESVAYNQAVDRFYERLRGSLDLSVDIAQAGQTARMVKAALKLSTYIRSFSPRNWSGKWLEYQYGWRPLVSTVYDTFDTVMRPAVHGLRAVSARGSSTEVERYQSPDSTVNQTKTSTAKVEICAVYRMGSSNLTRLAQYSSLNPLSIAWELVPYSFVVDWFYDIGGYLRATESALLYDNQFQHGYTTSLLVTEVTSQKHVNFDTGPTSKTIGSGRSRSKRVAMIRNGLSGSPYPRVPQFKVDLGSSRIMSAASLLNEFMRRR